MRPVALPWAAAALLIICSNASAADSRPLGEPLHVAGSSLGLTDADVALIVAAGGEFSCPGNGDDGARLNGWLISDRTVMTNAHGIIEGEEDPGHPYLRQPIAECTFTSYRQLGAAKPQEYLLDLNGLGAVLRRGARAPLDPTDTVAGDVVRLNLKRPVDGGAALTIDPAPVAAGDPLLLVSRVPTAYRTRTLPGDDLLVEKCMVKSIDRQSPLYPHGAVTDCNGAPGMSAGVLFTHAGGKLVAKGFLVSIEYVRDKGTKEEKVIGAHILLFDDTFQKWLGGDCAFWPAELKIAICGMHPGQ